MSYPPPLLVASYDDARAALEGREINQCPTFSRMGAESMTKTCYQNESYAGWVYLVSSNKRILDAEVTQLRQYGEFMMTPYLGARATDELVFEMTRKGEKAYCFLEMRFSAGYKEVKVKSDQDGSWLYREVLLNLKTTAQLTSLLEFITSADKYLATATEDIPDFQVAWDPGYGLMFMFDPGDPKNWGSALDSHKKAIVRWLWETTSSRLAKQIQKLEESGDGEVVPSAARPASPRPVVPVVPKLQVAPVLAQALTPPEKSAPPMAVMEARVEPSEAYMCHDCNLVFPGIIKLRTHRLTMHGGK